MAVCWRQCNRDALSLVKIASAPTLRERRAPSRAITRGIHHVIDGLAGQPSHSGFVSNCRQLSRSLVSASEQLGKQIDGGGFVCLALAGSGRRGAGTLTLEVTGKLALQPLASITGTIHSHTGLRQVGLGSGFDFRDLFTVLPLQLTVGF